MHTKYLTAQGTNSTFLNCISSDSSYLVYADIIWRVASTSPVKLLKITKGDINIMVLISY